MITIPAKPIEYTVAAVPTVPAAPTSPTTSVIIPKVPDPLPTLKPKDVKATEPKPKENKDVIDGGYSPTKKLPDKPTDFTKKDVRIFRDNARDYFAISYNDLTGARKTFIFDLLPAIDSGGQGRMSGLDVPEVKPGILRTLDVKHKNILIPGSTPAVQSIGINNAVINFVGVFTGSESIQAKQPSTSDLQTLATNKQRQDVLLAATGESNDSNRSSKNMSDKFFEEVVMPMTPVTVTVQSSNGTGEGVETMTYEGVIVKFKDYAVRQNRTYYTIDLLLTTYPNMVNNPN